MNATTQVRARQRERREWVRQNLANVAGNGDPLDPADVAALPESRRGEAHLIARRAVELYASGEQQEALLYARENFEQLEQKIGVYWSPPDRERPDPELLAEIRGRV